MTLNQLIEHLETVKKSHGGNLQIAMSKDPEGNGFHSVESPFVSFAHIDGDLRIKHTEKHADANTLILWPHAHLREEW